MSYKTITKASYQATAKEFAQNVADLAPLGSIEKFIDLLPIGATILDIGSGSGRDAKELTKRGVKVVGIDYSPNLINIAKTNAPLAEFHEMDIEEIAFPACSFDGVWAACSLSHIPKKTLPNILQKIRYLLKERGCFYLTLKKGAKEALIKDLRYEGNFEKYWAFYEEEELQKLLEAAKFKILELVTVEKRFAYQTDSCVRAFCQKS